MSARAIPVQRDLELSGRSAQCAALRALLMTGQTYTSPELSRLIGLRFGARLEEVRKGLDGGPRMDVRARPLTGRRNLWAYTLVGQLFVTPEQLEAEKAKQLKRLDARIARLQSARLALIASLRDQEGQ